MTVITDDMPHLESVAPRASGSGRVRTLYTVGYQASGERVRGKWHEIRVEVTPPDLTVRTKPGYFGR